MDMSNCIVNDKYAIYNCDCIEGMAKLPDDSIHFSIYSPPFCGLYNYSSSEQDLSNCKDSDEFFEHYGFLVKEKHRVTMPGRLSAVHVADVAKRGGGLFDMPGETIRLHEKMGFDYHARICVWKEPLGVAIRTRSKGLMHRQIVKDSSECNNAGADYILVFKKRGKNPVPIEHPRGLAYYAGAREIPTGLEEKFHDWEDPSTNKLAHWIWQQYASAFWDDIRVSNRERGRNSRLAILPYRHAKDKEEEKHCHPLQLDVIERCLQLWSNPGDKVLTPFMGVGSEVYGSVLSGRKGIGFELKDTYFRQASENLKLLESQDSEVLDFNLDAPESEPENEIA